MRRIYNVSGMLCGVAKKKTLPGQCRPARILCIVILVLSCLLPGVALGGNRDVPPGNDDLSYKLLNRKPVKQRAQGVPDAAKQDRPGVFQRFGERLKQVWNSSIYDFYLPAYTWHNRLMYDSNKIDNYNEHPWGAGLGRSFYDEDGDWHALYALGFMDSHSNFEPIVGYGFLKNWRLDEDGDWKVGVGYTLGITARREYDYIPLPLPLPLAGIEYKRFSVQAAYIPGLYNDGNVLFIWLRWQLTD